jgi:hypothetical protein
MIDPFVSMDMGENQPSHLAKKEPYARLNGIKSSSDCSDRRSFKRDAGISTPATRWARFAGFEPPASFGHQRLSSFSA